MDKADASEVGSHCSVCHSLDFLPFRCPSCNLAFCKDHASTAVPGNHVCQTNPGGSATQLDSSHAVQQQQQQPATASLTSASTSAQDRLSLKDLLPDRAPKPHVPSEAELARDAQKKAALALLEKNFPRLDKRGANAEGVSSSATGSRSATVKPVNAKVALMKLKQRAKAGDPRRNEKVVHAQDRHYVTASSLATPERSIEVWFPNDVTCGKALDLIADHLDIPNRNNLAATPASERLHLAAIVRSDTTAGADTASEVCLMAPSSRLADGVPNGGLTVVIQGSL